MFYPIHYWLKFYLTTSSKTQWTFSNYWRHFCSILLLGFVLTIHYCHSCSHDNILLFITSDNNNSPMIRNVQNLDHKVHKNVLFLIIITALNQFISSLLTMDFCLEHILITNNSIASIEFPDSRKLLTWEFLDQVLLVFNISYQNQINLFLTTRTQNRYFHHSISFNDKFHLKKLYKRNLL